MNKQTKIILIRHGQSIGNATRTILGHTDLDLSEHGYIQAQATANYLKEEKIDKIYSSDLKRAINTAIPHAEIRNINIVTNKNLRELYVGAWENMKVDDIILKWGREAYEKWIDSFGTFTFPNGESVCDGGQRLRRAGNPEPPLGHRGGHRPADRQNAGGRRRQAPSGTAPLRRVAAELSCILKERSVFHVKHGALFV